MPAAPAAAQTERPLLFRVETGPNFYSVFRYGHDNQRNSSRLGGGGRSRLSVAWPLRPGLLVVGNVGIATVGVLEQFRYFTPNVNYERWQRYRNWGALNDAGLGVRWTELSASGGPFEPFAELGLTAGRRFVADRWHPTFRTAWLAHADIGWAYWLNSYQSLTLTASYHYGLRRILHRRQGPTFAFPDELGQPVFLEGTESSRATHGALMLGYQWRLGKPPRKRFHTPRYSEDTAPEWAD